MNSEVLLKNSAEKVTEKPFQWSESLIADTYCRVEKTMIDKRKDEILGKFALDAEGSNIWNITYVVKSFVLWDRSIVAKVNIDFWKDSVLIDTKTFQFPNIKIRWLEGKTISHIGEVCMCSGNILWCMVTIECEWLVCIPIKDLYIV